MRIALVAAAMASALACAGAPPPDPQRGAVWGYVKLVPKDGTVAAGEVYGDRRVRDAALFDYSHPSFAVVYTSDGTLAAPASHSLALVETARGLAWERDQIVIGAADELVIANRAARPQIVSAPEAGWLRNLEPGESAALRSPRSGELEVHLLGTDVAPALVWVAPGAYAAADSAGRYELRGLEPGVARVRAWHPRLPPSAPSEVTLHAGEIVRLDLEIGVDRRDRDRGERSRP